jgi:hypothetical protein
MLSYAPDAITPSSKAIIVTNIGKLYLHAGEKTRAVEWIKKALETHRKIAIDRLRIDPALTSPVNEHEGLTDIRELISVKGTPD